MNRTLVVSVFGTLVLAMWLAAWGLAGPAGSEAELLTGEVWQTLSPDAKVAFVWGIGNLVEYERAQAEPRAAGQKSFIPVLIRGLRGRPINEVVRQVDAYYAAHPAERGRPVVDAIFQAVVLPAIRAEKGGTR
jgi:hypothetical protein